jgi:hypothetical protein
MFYKRLFLLFLAIIAFVLLGRAIFTPKSWGEFGYYRGDAITQEASKELVYGTNDACIGCHKDVYELKLESTHKRLSCEMCHAPVGEHALDGKKIADMPFRKADYQIELCLTCHAKTVGRPDAFPMIDHKQHLIDKKVKLTHRCDQCHTVHAPLENMGKKSVSAFTTLVKELNHDEN